MAVSVFDLSRVFYSQLFFVICAAIFVRVAVSMWGHSGEGKPPMYGDMEAQRHWMEITFNLPVVEWYSETPNNDLQYWGLDYPPLTAYHMMLNGHAAYFVNPDMVALHKSRGLETKETKIFMRLSVLLTDVLLFVPVVVVYFILMREKDEREIDVLLSIVVLLGYPGLILIDHGHFQYNNVSLGLFLMAVLLLSLHHDLQGAAVFCLALSYKQMELYHALPFFCFLLGRCIKEGSSRGLYKLWTLGFVVVITFLVIWSPFLMSRHTATSVIERIFPVYRGLYEDKVANFWCATSVVIKLKQLVTHSVMALICLVVTAIGLLPSSINLLLDPRKENFKYALVNSSLIFFLFSFHVHEKSILLAAVPACLLLKSDPLVSVWFLLISTFSMLPLLIKDGVLIPTIALSCLLWLISSNYLPLFKGVDVRVKVMFDLSMIGSVCLGLALMIVPPPARFPDLFPLLVAVYSCVHFLLFVLYYHFKQFKFNLDVKVLVKKNKPRKLPHSSSSNPNPPSATNESASTMDDRNLRRRKHFS